MINRKLRRSLLWTTIAICFSFCIQNSFGQSIQTSIDRKAILIGEPIHYKIQFTLPTSSYRIEFNVPDSFPHFEIMDKMKSDSGNAQGNYLVMQNIVLTSWDSGQWRIPSFPVKIRNTTDNAEYTLNTDSVLINVGYAKADSTGQLRDIKPVMDVTYFDPFWIFVGAGILIALVLLYLLYRYLKKRPKKEKPLFQSDLSAYDEAMRKLKELASAKLSSLEEAKVYHTSLAEIFKRYYSRKQQRNLLNRTTEDLLLLLKGNGVNTDTLSLIAKALRRGDAVKFAKYIPSGSESEQSLRDIGNGIEKIEKDQSVKFN